MTLIPVTGKKGSGKSTVLASLKRRGYFTTELDYHYKQLLKDKHQSALNLPPEDEWTDHIMRIVYENIFVNLKENPLFFCGMYRVSELQYLFSKNVPTEILAVYTPDTLRRERVLDRKREEEETLTLEELLVKDAKRDGTFPGYEKNNIDRILIHANYNIFNGREEETLEYQIDLYLDNLKKRGIIT